MSHTRALLLRAKAGPARPRLASRVRCGIAAVAVLAAGTVGLAGAQSPDASDWAYYGGDAFGQRFSNLSEINRDNVSHLVPAWTFRTGELGADLARADKLTFEATPVLAFGLLYVSTATDIVYALDPSSGTLRWRYDPHIDRARAYAETASRGVAVWQDGGTAPTRACSRRIFLGTLDARLIALDATTGRPCEEFGGAGIVDLTGGTRVGERPAFLVSSPAAVLHDTVIIGLGVGGDRAVSLERSLVRGFDVRTGALRWSFDPIPDSAAHAATAAWRADSAGHVGGANAWAVMSADPARGLVFAPTGSASPNHFGGERAGNNPFANSLLALDAATGKLVWQQQLVHHDLWSYDLAAQPLLLEITRAGESVSAVLEATRSGLLFGFRRDTGEPLYPIEERRVPRSRVPGEQSAPTQPFPQTPPLTSLDKLDPQRAWGITFWDRAVCRRQIDRYRNEGVYTPPDLAGTIEWPGFAGGVDWGGLAFDPRRERVFAAVNHLAMLVRLVPRAELAALRDSDELRRAEIALQPGTPYAVVRQPLLSPLGLPCNPPPWGTLVSVDLRRGRIAWEVPLGSTASIGPWFAPAREFGTPGMGGPIVTAGDLVFVGAAMDGYLRAYDVETGRVLWKYSLPAGGQATPMTYRAGRDQRQFVVIAAGGHGPLGTPLGDFIVAFSLPPRARGH